MIPFAEQISNNAFKADIENIFATVYSWVYFIGLFLCVFKERNGLVVALKSISYSYISTFKIHPFLKKPSYMCGMGISENNLFTILFYRNKTEIQKPGYNSIEEYL